MYDENLVRYIRGSLSSGRTEDVIRQLLLQKGWSQDKIDEAFNFVNGSPLQSQPPPASLPLERPAQSATPPGLTPKNSSAFNFFSYKGRVGRLKYLIGNIVVGIITTVFGFFAIGYGLYILARLIASLGTTPPFQQPSFFWPFLGLLGSALSVYAMQLILASSLIVKRFHDLDKSGKWWFALLIPFYNIHLAIGLLTERGTAGPNQYGEDPLPPSANPNDLAHRLSQNKVVRVILLLIIVLASPLYSVITHTPLNVGTPSEQFGNAINARLQQNVVINVKGKLLDGFPTEFILDKSAIVDTSAYEGPFLLNDYKASLFSDVATTTLSQTYLSYFASNGYNVTVVTSTRNSTSTIVPLDEIVINGQNTQYQVRVFIARAKYSWCYPSPPKPTLLVITVDGSFQPPAKSSTTASLWASVATTCVAVLQTQMPQLLTLAFPSGGGTFMANSMIVIQWNAKDYPTSYVDLVFRTGNEPSFVPPGSGAAAMRVENIGSSRFSLNGLSPRQYYLRITCDPVVSCPYNDSGVFTVTAP